LWDRRAELLDIVATAPKTLVHCDFWPTNIYRGDDGTTVAIDWSQIGIGAVAQDLDQITLDTVWMQVRPDESLAALESTIVPAYVAGLRDGGCDLAADDVQRWYAAAAAAHYSWLAGMQVVRVGQPDQVAAHEARFGWPFARLVANRAGVLARAVELGEWAIDG
jgi:aminoglycoside/choline kinase family phosphotransferase